MRFAPLVIALSLATPAAAEPSWDATHITLDTLAAGAGLSAGALLGAGLGFAVADDGFLSEIMPVVFGALIGGCVGGGTGAWAYGEAVDFDGSWLAATGGAALGTLTGFGVMFGMNELCDDCGGWAVLVFAVAGAVTGYSLSVDSPGAEPARSGSALMLPLQFGGRF